MRCAQRLTRAWGNADDKGGAGADHISANAHGQPFLWTPIRRTDISWNFEKVRSLLFWTRRLRVR